jgi:hypothetical protein
MGTPELDSTDSWTSQACTLPTAERPLRVAEFDRLFSGAARAVHRHSPTRLSIDLVPSALTAAKVAELVARETECCAFFTFTLTAAGGGLQLVVGVPDGHIAVLDALAARISKAIAQGAS